MSMHLQANVCEKVLLKSPLWKQGDTGSWVKKGDAVLPGKRTAIESTGSPDSKHQVLSQEVNA